MTTKTATKNISFFKEKLDLLDASIKNIVEKKEDILLLVKYSQRVYSEKIVFVDVKIYDKEQNKLNDFYAFLDF